MSMDIQKERPFPRFLRRNGAALAVMAGLFVLTYLVTFCFRSDLDADYTDHAVWALSLTPETMLSSLYTGTDHLWHICVRLLYYVVNNLWTAAFLVTAAANAAAYYLFFRVLDALFPQDRPPRWLLALIAAIPFLVNSLTLPGLSYYTGRGAVNTWHNPTNLMVRPFALAVFYMTVRIYDRRRRGGDRALPAGGGDGGFVFDGGFFAQFRRPVFTRAELWLYPLCILLSVYAKPSFVQCFGPAILVFLLIDVIRTRGMLLPFCLKLALAYLPAAVIALLQVGSFFPGGVSAGGGQAAEAAQAAASVSGAGIAVYFMEPSFAGFGELLRALAVRLRYIVLPCAGAFAVMLLSPRRSGQGRTASRLAVFCLAAAFLEYLLLHETGSRANDGNFGWSLHVAAWLVWTAAIAQYAGALFDRSRRGRLTLYIGSPLILWHMAAGLAYIIHILRTGIYYC